MSDMMDVMVPKESKVDRIKRIVDYLKPGGYKVLGKCIIYLELLTVAGLMFCFGVVHERYTTLNAKNQEILVMVQDHEVKIKRLNGIVFGPGAQ